MSSYYDKWKDKWGGDSWWKKKKDSFDDADYEEYTPWWKRQEKKKYTSRLGFGEEEHRKSYSYSYGGYYSGYSSYSTEKDKDLEVEKLEILKVAFNNSRDLVNILEFPFRINIYYDSDGYERNKIVHDLSIKERNIYINTIGYLEEIIRTSSDVTPENKEKCVQVISGNSLHEAAHMKFTSLTPVLTYFGTLSQTTGKTSSKFIAPILTENLYRIFKGMGFKRNNLIGDDSIENDGGGYIPNSLLYTIFSFLEDERVDTALLDERNGWFNYLADFKEYCYNKLFENSIVKKWKFDEEKVSLVEFFMTLIKMIRYSDKIDENILGKYSPSFEKAKEYINPKSTMESLQNTFSIFRDILMPIWNATAKGKTVEDFYRGEDVLKTFFDGSMLPYNERELLKKIITIAQKNTNVIVGNGEDGIEDLTNKELLQNILFRGEKDKINLAALDIITGEIDGDYKKEVYFYKPVGDLESYNSIKEKVSPFIPVMKNMVRSVNKDFDFVIHGQRSGKLDTTKLAEAYQGVPQVYVKKGVTKTSGMNVCVVIDESGSMSWGKKSILAREAGVLLNESFGFINGVDLYMYGHSADQTNGSENSTEIYIYREPGFIGSGRLGCGCSEIQARCENRDGVALESIATRIRRFTKQPVLMFVISDGSPSANGYRGAPAIKDTKEKVDKIENMGFYVIQITIDNSCVDASSMFKNYVDITNQVSELPQVLGGMVRNQIVKILQDNTSTTTI